MGNIIRTKKPSQAIARDNMKRHNVVPY